MHRHIENLIIGGGVAGLTVSYVLNRSGRDSVVVEKENSLGGLCRSFSMKGEWFDHGARVSFTKDPFVIGLLEDNVEHNSTKAIGYNYKNGKWIPHPVQTNLAILDTEEKIKIISDFVNRPNYDSLDNYQQWLESKYGRYFTNSFPRVYTRKYWTVEPKMMDTSWIGVRMYTPSLEEVLYGAFEKETPYLHYSGTSRYPIKGGFESFIVDLKENADALCNTNVTAIDLDGKAVLLDDNSCIEYENLVFSAPLPEIIPLIEQVPDGVLDAVKGLDSTSLVLVSLCLDKEMNMSGAYVYDEDICISRMYCTNKYSGIFSGFSAWQSEVYYSKYKPLEESIDSVKNRVIHQLDKMGLISLDQIVDEDVRYIPYANVIFTHSIHQNKRIAHDYIDKEGVYYAGRFADWD